MVGGRGCSSGVANKVAWAERDKSPPPWVVFNMCMYYTSNYYLVEEGRDVKGELSNHLLYLTCKKKGFSPSYLKSWLCHWIAVFPDSIFLEGKTKHNIT